MGDTSSSSASRIIAVFKISCGSEYGGNAEEMLFFGDEDELDEAEMTG